MLAAGWPAPRWGPTVTVLRYLEAVVLAGCAFVPIGLGSQAWRRRLLPGQSGPPAVLATTVIMLAVTLAVAEGLGTVGIFHLAPVTIGLAAVGALGWYAGPPPLVADRARVLRRPPGPSSPQPRGRKLHRPGCGPPRGHRHRGSERRVGQPDRRRVASRDDHRRHPLVPHALRRPLRPAGVDDAPALRGHRTGGPVLPGQLRAAARRGPPDHGQRSALATGQPGLDGALSSWPPGASAAASVWRRSRSSPPRCSWAPPAWWPPSPGAPTPMWSAWRSSSPPSPSWSTPSARRATPSWAASSSPPWPPGWPSGPSSPWWAPWPSSRWACLWSALEDTVSGGVASGWPWSHYRRVLVRPELGRHREPPAIVVPSRSDLPAQPTDHLAQHHLRPLPVQGESLAALLHPRAPFVLRSGLDRGVGAAACGLVFVFFSRRSNLWKMVAAVGAASVVAFIYTPSSSGCPGRPSTSSTTSVTWARPSWSGWCCFPWSRD